MILYCDVKAPKVVYMNENKIGLLRESLSSLVYHFTSIGSVFNILETNEMFCQSAKVGGGADDYSEKYDFYISLTRTKSSQEGFGYNSSKGSCARIEFDGDKLNHNFHGEPINYWGGGEGLLNKFSYMRQAQNNKHFEYQEITDPNEIAEHNFEKLPPLSYIKYANEDSPQFVKDKGKYYEKIQTISPDVQHHQDNEIEDRLFTNKPYITNIRDYIRRIDIFIDETRDLGGDILSLLTQLSLRYSNIVFIYNNLKDFDAQNENVVNKKYQEMYSEYGRLMPYNSKKTNLDALSNICNLITFLDNNDEKPKKKALLLKQYGLEKYTSAVIKKRDNFWGLQGLFDNLMSDTHNISKDPFKDGQIMLKMLNDFLRKNGYKSLRDAYVKIQKELDERSHGGYNWDNIDTQSVKEFKVINVNGYKNYIIDNDSETDFWHIFELDDKDSRYSFIDNFIWDLERGTYGENYLNVIRGGNVNKFTKYLQSLAHGKVTLGQMFNIFTKLGTNAKDVIDNELGYNFEIGTIQTDYWDSNHKRLYPPFQMDYDEVDMYLRNKFKKA